MEATIPVDVELIEQVLRALRLFAEDGIDLTDRMCHRGLVAVEACGRCQRVLEARRVFTLLNGALASRT